MLSLASLPTEIHRILFQYVDPSDLKALRLTSRVLRALVGHEYLRHVVLTLHREHWRSFRRQLSSSSLSSRARCIQHLTIDVRLIESSHGLTRTIYKDDPVHLILRNYQHTGDNYNHLSSQLFDFCYKDRDLVEVLEGLEDIIQKLPNLRQITVAEQKHYVKRFPAPHFIIEELRDLHPVFGSCVDEQLATRLMSNCITTTRLASRIVILAVERTKRQTKVAINFNTLHATYGQGGNPTTLGLYDVLDYAEDRDSKALVLGIRRHRGYGEQHRHGAFGSMLIGEVYHPSYN